ncbi:MDR family MFS transporter [Cytobacillus firmus]|uniref:MDR family MFS transporter n=1 Tax=Cytobacillus firmus TaxID=1399 RepID=UPI002FFD73E0
MIKTIKSLGMEVRVVLLGILIINIGNFMVIPFLSLYLGFTKSLPPSQVGMVLTISIAFQYGLSFFGGLLSDRFGKKNLLLFGLGGRSLGLLLYAFSDSLILYCASSALIGIGQSFYTPSSKAIIASVPAEIKAQVFALRSTAVNIGAALGPILGGILFNSEALWVFSIAFLIHLVVFTLIAIFVKKENQNIELAAKSSLLKSMFTVLKDKRITSLMLISSLFWFLYFQLNFTIPIFVKDQFNSTELVGLLFTVNGIIVILLQFGIIKWVTRKLDSFAILSIGMLFTSCSFFILGVTPAKFSLFLFIFLFTLGEMLFIPSSDNLASDLAQKDKLGGYLGLMTMGWAFGGVLGNTVGGYLYEIFSHRDSLSNLWFLYTGGGFIISIILITVKGFFVQREIKDKNVSL